MKEETRIIIAFGLALLVIILFSMNPKKEQVPPQQQKITPYTAQTLETSYKFDISNNQVDMKNQLYNASLDLLGGKIVSFSLNNYKRPGEKDFSFFTDGITLLDMVDDETNQVMYKLEKGSDNSFFVLNAKRENFQVEKIIKTHPEKYSMHVEFNLKNLSEKSLHTPDIKLYLGSLMLNKKSPEESTIEFMVTNGGKPYRFNVARQMKEKISGNTCVVKTRYQMYYFKLDKPVEFYVENKDSRITWGFYIPSQEIDTNKDIKLPFVMYIGPSDYYVARDEIKDIKIFGTGFFVSMGRLIFYVLNSIHRVIPNWGFAIIILTILIKIIFFPLTRKSMYSMKQMQKLRPYLQDIQKKYKDNPQMLQKEMMSLYKTYKINPFSGCLPMLIQIPIFVGFFLALRNSIYLRGSGFIFWIKDLSLPDTVARIGSIPVNILPVLMFVTSFFQQRMTPVVEPSQKIMNLLFPVMMLVLFYNFSSGLLLYWVTMNIAGLVEQYYIYKIAKK